MRVSHVAVDDFRSYRHAVVEFGPGVTILVGANGHGKTNLVEAVAYLSAFSSHRVSAEAALVRLPAADEDPVGGAVVRVRLIQGEKPAAAGDTLLHKGDDTRETSPETSLREHVLELEIVRGKANRARLNRTQIRPRDIVGMVRSVIFAPEDLSLIRGEPGIRRAFLDDIVIQRHPVMLHVKADFEKVAKQRAALMKNAQARMRRGYVPDLSTLDIWDEQFAALSARLSAERARVVRELSEPAARAYDKVSDSPKNLTLAFDASVDSYASADEAKTDIEDISAQTERLIALLSQLRDREIDRGVNLAGAHRDDLNLSLGGMPVKGYASHGESWSVALALRLASFDALVFDGEQPILILDDVFAELDAQRRIGLANLVANVEQVLITAAVIDDVPDILDGRHLFVRTDPTSGSVVSDD